MSHFRAYSRLAICSWISHFQQHIIYAQMLRQMLRRINNYIFPDETLLTFAYPRWWWNRMRSSCWNAPAVSVLLGLIGGVCWALHGHTGLASDPKQLLSRQGLQLRMPDPSPRSSPGRHIWKTLLWPSEGRDPAVNVFWHIWLGKAPVISLSVFGVSYFQQTGSRPLLDFLINAKGKCKFLHTYFRRSCSSLRLHFCLKLSVKQTVLKLKKRLRIHRSDVDGM